MTKGKKDVEQLKGILQQFRKEDIEKALKELELPAEEGATPFKVMKMSDLPEEKERRTRVVVMDKKMRRKMQSGEELKLEEIADDEGVLEYTEAPESTPGLPIVSGPTISSSALAGAVVRDFGQVCSGGAVFLSDGYYFLYPDGQVKKVLTENLTDLQMWINTYFDCDDFSQVVAGLMNEQLKGVPFGVLWFKGPGIYHAVNCFYSKNQKKMKVVEPQTDGIYDFDKSRYCPMLVVI